MRYDPHKVKLSELEHRVHIKVGVIKFFAVMFSFVVLLSAYFVFIQFAAPQGPEMTEIYLCLGLNVFCSLFGLWAWLDYRHARQILERIKIMSQHQRTSQQNHKMAEMTLNLEHESRGLQNSKRLRMLLMAGAAIMFCGGLAMLFIGLNMMSKGKPAGGTVLGSCLIWFIFCGFAFKHALPMGSEQQTKVNALQRELKVLRTRQRAKAGDISVAQPQQSGQLSQAQSVQSGELTASENVILDFSEEQVTQTHHASQQHHQDS